MPAAMKLGEYEHWQTNRLSVALRDYENRSSFFISYQAFSFEQDSNDKKHAINNINRAIEILPNALQVKSYLRLGFRCYYLIPVDMKFESLVSIMGIKTFLQDENFRNIFPYKLQDLMIIQDFKEEDYMCRVTIAPITKAQIPEIIIFNHENHLKPEVKEKEYALIKENYPEASVLLDIDFSKSKNSLPFPLEDAIPFFEEAQIKIDELVKNLNEYFFSQDIKE
jgi:uncharacterized protein YqfB (UPF0267 family)